MDFAFWMLGDWCAAGDLAAGSAVLVDGLICNFFVCSGGGFVWRFCFRGTRIGLVGLPLAYAWGCTSGRKGGYGAHILLLFGANPELTQAKPASFK